MTTYLQTLSAIRDAQAKIATAKVSMFSNEVLRSIKDKKAVRDYLDRAYGLLTKAESCIVESS